MYNTRYMAMGLGNNQGRFPKPWCSKKKLEALPIPKAILVKVSVASCFWLAQGEIT